MSETTKGNQEPKSMKLWLSDKASKQLKEKQASNVEKPTSEDKLADRKRRDEEHGRLRARRKAMFENAKLTDRMLTQACDSYDVAAKAHIDHKKVLKGFSDHVDKLKDEAKVLDDQIKKLQSKWRSKRDAYGKAKCELNDFSVRLTEAARGRDNVQAAWDVNQVAWGKLNKAQVKRYRDRAAKKRAKEILR